MKKQGATVLLANMMGRPVGEPVTLDRRRRRLSAVVKRYADPRRPYIVSRHKAGDVLRPEDHTVVAREAWSRTLVAHDDIILITHLPLGGGRGASGKQIGTAIAMLALSLAAPYAVGALGVSALGTIAAGVPALTPLGSALSLGMAIGDGRAFR